ncbi:MAG: J domain-containing protein [Ferrimicrobium sp.]
MARSADRTYYEVLDVSRDASQQEIQSAYRRLALQVHPDKGGSAALFQLINDAWTTLSNPEARRAYNATLDGTAGSKTGTNPNGDASRQGASYRDAGYGASGHSGASYHDTSAKTPPQKSSILAAKPAELLLGAGLILVLAFPTTAMPIGLLATVVGGIAVVGKFRLRREARSRSRFQTDPLTELSGISLFRAELFRGFPVVLGALGILLAAVFSPRRGRRRR